MNDNLIELKSIPKPTKVYAEILESEAIDQFKSAMAQPYAVSGALMPDAHTGYALPIGAVVSTDGVVVPSWVGYDIGCGMCALKLPGINPEKVSENKKAIFDRIYETIPVGFNINKQHIYYPLDGLTEVGKQIACEKNHSRALGSLGGGNHFIEIGVDEEGYVWVVIHSGSRGVGHGIATHYMKLAHPEGRCKDGHFGFDENSQEGRDYIQDMKWCLDFAIANRKEMVVRVADAVGANTGFTKYWPELSGMINKNHNHAVKSGGLWIHRKGATQAENGTMGVIPGNMRDGSFIVRGKGNPDSLNSSSHGAGRVLGRKEAKRVLNVEDFEKTMVGIQAKVDDKTLDEAPFAYKDIFEVMRLQSDLVEVKAHIKPIINIKG